MGRHTKYGGYVIEWKKVRTYVVPPLEDFKVSSRKARWYATKAKKTPANAMQKLTPFVTNNMPATRGVHAGDKAGPRNAKLYLSRWKTENGLD